MHCRRATFRRHERQCGVLRTFIMTILERVKLWQTASLSLICDDLFEFGYSCTIEYQQTVNGKWISVKIEKDGEKWGGIGGSRLDVARNKLIRWIDSQGIRDSLMS